MKILMYMVDQQVVKLLPLLLIDIDTLDFLHSSSDVGNVDIGNFWVRVLLPGSNLVEAFKRA